MPEFGSPRPYRRALSPFRSLFRFKGFVSFLATGCILLPPIAYAQDWAPELLSAKEDLGRLDPIKVALPAPVNDQILVTVTVDLDGVDVTKLAKVERSEKGFVVTIVPPQALSAGAHRIRFVEYHPEGDVIERGVFNLQVKSALQVMAGANITMQGASRFEDKNLGNAGGEEQASGSVQLGTQVKGDGWEVAGEASILGDSQKLNTREDTGTEEPRIDKSIDLGEYLMQARTQHLSAMVGHHAMDRQSLIMQNFHRRGTSFTGQTNNQALSASAFAFRTEPITGAHNFFGIEDSEDRVYGTVVSAKPIPGHGNALTLSGMWLKGEGRDQSGVGVDGDETRSQGEAFSLIAESRILSDRVRLRGEFANADYRFDSTNPNTAERDDDAYSVMTEFVPWRRAEPGQTSGQWIIGAEYQQVGLFFASPANPTLPSDKELVRGYTTFQFGSFAVQGSYAQEEDNVNDSPLLPTSETRSGQIAISWSKQPTLDQDGRPVVPWYGIPSISIAYQDIDQQYIKTLAQFPNGLDRQFTNAQANASFQYNKWAWALSYGNGEEKDGTGTNPERRNELFGLTFTAQPWERFSFSTQVQHNRLEDQTNANTQKTNLWNTQFNWAIIKDQLVFTAYTSFNTDDNSNNTIDSETTTVGGNLNYQIIKTKPNRPGLALWLRGERRDVENKLNPANDQEQYQIFAGLTLGWSPTYHRPAVR